MSDFAAPAAGGGDNWIAADSVEHLCVFDVLGQEQGVETDYGPKDPIRATVHDIDAQATYEDSLIFQGYIVGSLKRRVGQKVLARIVLGEAKKGQKPPYLLEDASGDAAAAARATAYLAAYAAGQFAAPAETAPVEPAPQVDLTDPTVLAALAALQKQGAI